MKFIILSITMLILLIGSAAAELGTTKMNFTAIDDAKISSGSPDSNYRDIQLKVGVSGADVFRTYIKFDISKIPFNSNIIDSKMQLQKFGGSGSSNIDTFRVLDNSWDEDFLTWDNAPNSFSNLISSTFVGSVFNILFDMTNGVTSSLAYYQGQNQNNNKLFSIMLRNTEETPSFNYHLFQNKEQSDFGPILEVTFQSNKPNITQINIPSSAQEGDTLNLQFTAADADNNIILYQIYFNGQLLTNSSSASYRVNYEESGINQVKFLVKDETGLTTEEIKNITISDVVNLKINEIIPIPIGNNEWLEIYNPTDSNKSVSNCKIKDGFGNTISLNGTVEAKSFGVASNLGQFVYGGSLFNDNGDMARLFCDNLLVDKVTYGSWDDGNLGDNVQLPQAGESIGRKNDGVDADNDIVDFVIYSQPTPLETNNNITCIRGDIDCNGCLTLLEVLNFITEYRSQSSNISLLDVLNVISDYKTGGSC